MKALGLAAVGGDCPIDTLRECTAHAWVLLVDPMCAGSAVVAWADTHTGAGVLPVTPLNPAMLLMAIMARGERVRTTPDAGWFIRKTRGSL